jgi:hypothetical protein
MNTEYYITPVPFLPSQCPVFVSRKYGQPNYSDKLAKDVVRKSCIMDVRMGNAQKDPDGKPVGMRPLWRPMRKG